MVPGGAAHRQLALRQRAVVLVEDNLEVALAPPRALLVAVTDLVRRLADGEVLLSALRRVRYQSRHSAEGIACCIAWYILTAQTSRAMRPRRCTICRAEGAQARLKAADWRMCGMLMVCYATPQPWCRRL